METESTRDRSMSPASAAAHRVMFEAEQEFMSNPTRKTTSNGVIIDDSIDTSDWYIRPVEGGPPPFKTKAEFDVASDQWFKAVGNQQYVQVQLTDNGIIDHFGEPYGKQPGTYMSPNSSAYDAITTLIDNYEYESEPDADVEAWRKRRNPKWEAPKNRFTEFLKKRQDILSHLNEESEDDGTEDEGDVEDSNECQEMLAKKCKAADGMFCSEISNSTLTISSTPPLRRRGTLIPADMKRDWSGRYADEG